MHVLAEGRSCHGLDSVGANASIDCLVISEVLGEHFFEDGAPKCAIFTFFTVARFGTILGQWEIVINDDGHGHS